MKYYPINLDLKNRSCLVVGAGLVAFRKIEMLIKCKAIVTVISPKIEPKIMELFYKNLIFIKQKKYESCDLEKKFMVIGATNNEKVNIQISLDAKKYKILYNIVDNPKICNFILPSILSREDFMITVSTAGKSPAFAKKVRKDLESFFGFEYGKILRLMGAIRLKLFHNKNESEKNKEVFENLIKKDLLSLIKNNKTKEINKLIHKELGNSFNYKELIK